MTVTLEIRLKLRIGLGPEVFGQTKALALGRIQILGHEHRTVIGKGDEKSVKECVKICTQE